MISIIRTGVIFAVYLFLAISFFFLISSPVDVILGAMDDVPLGEATDEMALILPNIRTAVSIAFALGIAAPFTWFIVTVFSREPYYGSYRRY